MWVKIRALAGSPKRLDSELTETVLFLTRFVTWQLLIHPDDFNPFRE
jgi:hypothetical protein